MYFFGHNETDKLLAGRGLKAGVVINNIKLPGYQRVLVTQRCKMVVGASMTIGDYVLPRLLGAFTKKFPTVEPTMTTYTEKRFKYLSRLITARQFPFIEKWVSLPLTS
ncbi:hypothetical protein SAMN05660649_04040 [Desulfotomaculum arcticum]|uniref:Uncharacterized protein n=1 Tax=Desulfotruncus arcticus DSM 17038 TaxID=1121424 RepID=A0A1I2XMG5_9FIRM|nr:hypothetical protein [Desulfotruncus arcticus]SFH14650.1 hypothetical protein SAMN05660649_04040 [Desulfotomaculum arcticum] [Desulfotruncus arcticus DSM 17038]